ncbi:hypothetical protein KLA_15945 [Cellulophaga geojensis KL-A]|uniref:DUF547 domain-containing protein n=1 Tax=Cellulophaga geojensis KL-A TaxID=1328323 RepID=A0ABN0RJV5_9FLAO|nr:DUF547 domain-containing protein [Cellulophaga geojensis]EWH11091.1 hypothetical protein KLA_15945 [Cellulophaga geojensis KL-A]
MAYKISAVAILLTLVGFFYFGSTPKITEKAFNKVPSHQKWNALLQKNVNTNGDVNYKAFVKNKAELEAYLKLLQDNSPAKNWSKNDKLAYYINLYNAGTVKLIVDNYPVKSIKDIKSPWDKEVVAIGNKMYSLGYVEHKVLRKMNEPRIHFAINCASYSCPKLVNKAFLADSMDAQLKSAAINFIADKKRNVITPNKVELSEIFKWFKSDFTENTTLIGFINKYSATQVKDGAKVKYIDYNWSLNEAK